MSHQPLEKGKDTCLLCDSVIQEAVWVGKVKSLYLSRKWVLEPLSLCNTRSEHFAVCTNKAVETSMFVCHTCLLENEIRCKVLHLLHRHRMGEELIESSAVEKDVGILMDKKAGHEPAVCVCSPVG